MNRDALSERLFATFLEELDDHVRAIGGEILAIERASEPEERSAMIQSVFRRVHSLKGAARAVGVEQIESACHRAEGILSAARDGERAIEGETTEVLLELADALGEARALLAAKRELHDSRLSRVLPRLDAAAGRRSGAAPAQAVKPAQRPAARPQVEQPPHSSAPAQRSDNALRVAPEKLDALLSESGEMLAARRRLMSHRRALDVLEDETRRWAEAWRTGAPRLAKLVEVTEARTSRRERRSSKRVHELLSTLRGETKRIAREIERLNLAFTRDHEHLERVAGRFEERARRMRMVPFEDACLGLDRAVRDLAKVQDKEIEVVIEGNAVELDRAVLDALRDPLLHLVRNAVAHGIEPIPVRRASGKRERGRVTISATLRSGLVEIAVEDDGRGLDLAALGERARARGIPIPEDERDVARLVFLPGVSTSRTVTELAGRGVGLDVVKTTIEGLHGSIDVAHAPAKGTRFALTVPLTLSTFRALFAGVAGQIFAVPGANVINLARVKAGELRSVGGRDVFAFGESLLPVVSLAQTLGVRDREPLRAGAKALLVLVKAGTMRAAFAVDEVISEQEIVMKPLGRALRRIAIYAGATVLDDGRVALVLSAADLIRAALGAPAHGIAAALEEAPDLKRRRVVLADDSITIRALEKSILESAGYEVLAAADGVEALALLREHGADVLVADVEMPRMDGFQLTEAVRASKQLRSLPIVLVTALEAEEHKLRGLELGADAYLVKSAFDQQTLLDVITQLVR